MPNLTKELVRLFNANNYSFATTRTSFNIDNDYMTMIFDSNMNKRQCTDYLQTLKRKIIGKFYSGKDLVGVTFDFKSFPFNFNDGNIVRDEYNKRLKLEIPITRGVIFNLQGHAAHSMARAIVDEIDIESGDIGNAVFKGCDKSKYVLCIEFPREETAKDFTSRFGEELTHSGYSPSNYVIRNERAVYIARSLFNDMWFIKKCTDDELWGIGQTFEIPSSEQCNSEVFKHALVQFIYCTTGIRIDYFDRVAHRKWDSGKAILVPIVSDKGGLRYLNLQEAGMINEAFNFDVVNDVSDCSIGLRGIERLYGAYGIDCYNKNVSNCIIDAIFENSRMSPAGKDEYKYMIQPTPNLGRLYSKIVGWDVTQSGDGYRPEDLNSTASTASYSSEGNYDNPGTGWQDHVRPSTSAESRKSGGNYHRGFFENFWHVFFKSGEKKPKSGSSNNLFDSGYPGTPIATPLRSTTPECDSVSPSMLVLRGNPLTTRQVDPRIQRALDEVHISNHFNGSSIKKS